MKRIIIILSIMLATICLISYFTKTSSINCSAKSDYLRIHIRANSNEYEDQSIKYTIKDEVIKIITPLISKCNNKKEVEEIIKTNASQITEKVNEVLKLNNIDYKSNLSLKSELFPTRVYNDIVFESGVYDAIIVELGEAKGNNWWCVAYPPLCFVDYTNSGQIEYRSKIIELINKFFNQGE